MSDKSPDREPSPPLPAIQQWSGINDSPMARMQDPVRNTPESNGWLKFGIPALASVVIVVLVVLFL